jgi:hypothetical protein
MQRSIKTALLSALAIASLAGPALAQSTPDDPLGINVTEDPTIQQQRGGLTDGKTGGIGRPYGWRNRETLDNWSNDMFLEDINTAE